jgi:hypothetical protein
VKFRKRKTFHPDPEALASTALPSAPTQHTDIRRFIESFQSKGWDEGSPKKRRGRPRKVVQDDSAELVRLRREVKELRDKAAEPCRNCDAMATALEQVIGTSQRALDGRRASQDGLKAVLQNHGVPRKGPAVSKEGSNVSPQGPVAPAKGGAQQRILDALAQLETFGLESPHRSMVAAHAGLKPTGGYFTNTLGTLRSRGLIDYPRPSHITLTDEARKDARYPKKPPTLRDLHDSWLALVSGLQQRVLEVLIERYPEALSRQDLAEAVGTAAGGGYFTNTLGALRTLGAVEYPQSGQVRASGLLFPKKGRR